MLWWRILKKLELNSLYILSTLSFLFKITCDSNAEFLIARITEISEIYYPTNKINLISDEADNRLLELAQLSKADFLITGNTNDFKLNKFENSKIITPKEFWEVYSWKKNYSGLSVFHNI